MSTNMRKLIQITLILLVGVIVGSVSSFKYQEQRYEKILYRFSEMQLMDSSLIAMLNVQKLDGKSRKMMYADFVMSDVVNFYLFEERTGSMRTNRQEEYISHIKRFIEINPSSYCENSPIEERFNCEINRQARISENIGKLFNNFGFKHE